MIKKTILVSSFGFAVSSLIAFETEQKQITTIPVELPIAPKAERKNNFVLPTHGTVKGTKYTLPDLPYKYNALKPYIDTKTMHIHHDKHHQKYVDKLNEAVKKYPKFQGMPLDSLLKNPDALPADVKKEIINNGGGHYAHSLYWRVMGPKSSGPSGALALAFKKKFGSFSRFKAAFEDASKNVFGSGWTWLSVDPKGQLIISTTANQDTPLKDKLTPILCLDEWEHAYYLLYKNEREKYIQHWWNVVNWDYVSELYKHVISDKM